jgi:PAS domain S-box-containing protein
MNDRTQSGSIASATLELLVAAFDQHPSAFAVTDAALRVVLANDAWARLTGSSHERGTDLRPALDHAFGSAAAEIVVRLEQCVAGGANQRFECNVGAQWLELRARRFVQGDRAFLWLMIEDVTSQRAARDHVEASEALLRTVVDTAPDYVFFSDEHDRIAYMSRIPEEMRARIIGAPLESLTAPSHLAMARACWDETRRTGQLVEYEIPGHGPGAEGLWFAMRVRRLVVPGRAPGLIFFATDITARRRTEHDLRASQQSVEQFRRLDAVGQLAGGVAHDFNNLLTAIRYHVAFALDLAPTPALQRELKSVDRAAEAAADLTTQLLALGGRQTLQLELVDPAELVGSLLPMLDRLCGPQIEVRGELDPTLGVVRADRSQLQSVVTNLVVNARDAIAKQGSVTISTRGDGDRIVIAVEDTGSGMSPEVKARIFEPFFTTKKRGRGHGLGLATAWGIVTQSGGTLEVHSELGKGSRFEIRLPRLEGLATTPIANATPAGLRLRTTARILLVEDDAELRVVIERSLTAAGHTVHGAERASEALAWLARGVPIDLLVSDVVLPEMNGVELAKAVRRDRPNVPVLLVSGYTGSALESTGIDELDVAFLPKPFAPRVLLGKVLEVLARAS